MEKLAKQYRIGGRRDCPEMAESGKSKWQTDHPLTTQTRQSALPIAVIRGAIRY